MATIVGGIATSHTPTIAFAKDANKFDDPVWKPIFEGYEPVQQWMREKKPDVLVYIYNDHMTAFFDHYSHFALGVGESYGPADEGGGPRDIPAISGDPKLAQHIAKAMVADEFDLSYFQGKKLDHGAFSPLSVILDYDKDGWAARFVPIACGVLTVPLPSAKRFWKFGKSLRRAIQSYPEDIKVAIIGTGGLSHQVHGERNGFNNTEWDMEFMDRLEKHPEGLLDYPVSKLAELGGWEGAEVVMWMMMRAALSEEVECTHKTYFLPSMTPIATMIMEEKPEPEPRESDEAFRARMEWDWEGAAALEGTYPFTIERSVKGFRINHFLHSLIDPKIRRAFKEDEEKCLAEADLTDEERDLIRRRDWIGMIHYGVIFFMLEKLGAVTGVGNIHIYAAMKGMSVEEFQKTRNAAITYGVAGKEEDDD
ncbi:gallate dioxygenase [Altererythrobacter atlanticus]|uniref:Gallate dioxygenase n=1 Tax=Croceibacterium atlanticum TaxID=1267766 RepID=A0A0F7KWM6_9SPHN|nr:gallate dioxygenase [Croceibacterium atlanticum]AKH44064.1 Gallate dioxygenase [Croceibacterium atlanticum]MBB5732373.1 gallate dioxygenase [Croceibacterium atlanticum]